MNELNDEIKLTLDLMQTDIDDGAHSELRYHLVCLMGIKRNEIQQRLVAEPVTHDQVPCNRWQFGDPDKPLTVDGLISGGGGVC